MKNVLKKLAFPLVACGVLLAGSAVRAQTLGDIWQIYQEPAEPGYAALLNTPGDQVAFRIRLSKVVDSPPGYPHTGNAFGVGLTPAGLASGMSPETLTNLFPFGILVQTGTGVGIANYSGLEVSPPFTMLKFTYMVRPGDLALPMTLVGNGGAIGTGEEYQFVNTGYWHVYDVVTTNEWVPRFGPAAPSSTANATFANANVRLQTLKFNTLTGAEQTTNGWIVQQTTTYNNSRIQTWDSLPVTKNIPLYVWSGDTNIAYIVDEWPNLTNALTMIQNTSECAFRIYGRNEGETLIYMGPSANTQAGVTNYITRRVVVTPPPPPTVSVALDPLGAEMDGFVHLSESDVKDRPLHVRFSQAYNIGPVTVRLDVSPAGAVALETNRVTLAAGATESLLVRYAPADGTNEVTITPVIETVGAVAYFTGTSAPAKIKIANVVPAVSLGSPTPNPPLSTQTTVFPWSLTDVSADVSAGVVFRWSFGDGSVLVQTNFTDSGTVSHIYNNPTAANYTLRLEVKDKDMNAFVQVAEMSFTVDLPLPTPKLEIITQSSAWETSGVIRVQFALSQTYAQDITVQLAVDPPEWTNNIAFQDLFPGQTLPGTVTLPAGSLINTVDFDMGYRVLDGNTNNPSLTFRPVVVSTPGDPSYYTPVPRNIFIRNSPPVITKINEQSAASVTNVSVPATTTKTFSVEVKDVVADLAAIRTYWVFGDDPTTVHEMAGVPSPLLGTARAAIDHTFATPGVYAVRVWAEDKDQAAGASVDAYHEFYVVVGAPPAVRVRPPSGALSEDEMTTANDFIVVELTAAPPVGAVYVTLSVAPVNSSANGSLVLDTTSVVFTRAELDLLTLEKNVYINSLLKDGTRISNSAGFTITPTVTGTADAQAFYGANLVSGVVKIQNEAPVITNPQNMDVTGAALGAIVGQGTAYTFYWEIKDAFEDWNGESGSTVEWYFGDDTSYTSTLRSGSYSKTYTKLGIRTVRVVARDKDGGVDEVRFNVRVDPAKKLIVMPVGHPNGSAPGTYGGADGLGRGIVVSTNAVVEAGLFDGEKYEFSYAPAERQGALLAIPTIVDGIFDSFMYRWIGEGVPEHDLTIISPKSTFVTLQEVSAGTDGQAAQVEEQTVVDAIFSREWRPADNCGDINGDGIPDRVAATRKWLSGETLNEVIGSDLTPANSYNGDNDFLPDRDNVSDWIIPNLGTYAPVGRQFDAYREARGYHPGLNRLDFGSEEDFGPGEEQVHIDFGPNSVPYTRAAERPTDPTVDDSDNDGYPDGWEYYFWYNTLVNHVTGSRYNPDDIATGITIPWEDLYLSFDPLTPAGNPNRDIDNDGLTDLEELAIGTNPIHWDTDGDGMCDGWEVMRGLDPLNANDRDDGQDPRYNNVDGDYMAISVVKRDLVTGTDGKTYLQDKNGNLTSWYRYGTTNATTPIAVGRPITGVAVDTAVPAQTDQNVLILHFQVYQEFGFDARTAWCGSVKRMPDYAKKFPVPDGWTSLDAGFRGRFGTSGWQDSDAANTRPFTAYDEYLLMKFMAENGLASASTPPTSAGWHWSTHPKTPDSDATDTLADGVPDGWELYVMCKPGTRTIGISPWSADDGDDDEEEPGPELGDGLIVQREFSGTDSAAAYASAALYTATTVDVKWSADSGVTYTAKDLPKNTIVSTDPAWINKFWPSNPWSKDTDGDGVQDAAEAAFIYGGFDNNSTCIAGGGLNPCSIDTDLDGLPDGFELEFKHSSASAADGMNGTVQDASEDWDADGLQNYQEYWVQAVRSFRYDITTNDIPADVSITGSAVVGLPMDMTFEPSSLFTEVTNTWDVARYPWGDTKPPLWVLLPVGANNKYVSTDPRDADTDKDSLDDFYEMFHGLNPILSTPVQGDAERIRDRVARAYIKGGSVTITYAYNDWWPNPMMIPLDFVSYPWLTGLQDADPDADGLLTFEEMLQPNQPSPSYHNTDPTPLWLTDSSSPYSVTARFYDPRLNAPAEHAEGRWQGMFFWPLSDNRPAYVFSFEENEGYDTDNDGLSDKDELTQGMGGFGDPQDHDDPIRRQALWFDGTESAAWTPNSFNYGAYAFRSFTVELWVRPETVTNDVGQILIERPVVYSGASDLSVPETILRRTFQIGIAPDGRAYAMLQNAGFHDEHTGTAEVYGPILREKEWVHLVARMDGAQKALTLFVNGVSANSVPTELIPATGVFNVSTDPNAAANDYIFTTAPLVLGARTLDGALLIPTTWDIAFERFFHGWLDEVRVWDGARSSAAIAADFRTRYTKAQELASQGALIFHYTFDNLFGAMNEGAVVQVPRGFNADAVTINRPAGYQVGWWSIDPLRSTVYADYSYVPWIENGMDHLPLADGAVQNSKYWTTSSAGKTLISNDFPNSNNPYGWGYGFVGSADLLPLGHAYARTLAEMWDNQGGSSRWSDTNDDTDSDGLSDAWEMAVYGDLNSNWNSLYPDGSGLTAGEKYTFELAAGDPNDPDSYAWTADSDHDGLPDWWESLYGLNPNDASGINGADGDPDEDGLSNYYEYLARTNPYAADSNANGVSDYDEDADGDYLTNGEEQLLGTHPGMLDSDDDGLADFDEVANGLDPADPLSPYVPRTLVNDGSGYVSIPKSPIVLGVQADSDGLRCNLTNWTVSARVKLTAAPSGDIIVIQRWVTRGGAPLLNYELGIDGSTLVPYVRFQTTSGQICRVDGFRAVELNVWSTLTGRFGPAQQVGLSELALIQDGVVNALNLTGSACAVGPQSGDMTVAVNLIGEIDEVMVWTRALSDAMLASVEGGTLLFGTLSERYSVDYANMTDADWTAWLAADDYSYVYDSTTGTYIMSFGSTVYRRDALANGSVALYLPFDDGRWTTNAVPQGAGDRTAGAVDDFLYAGYGWQTNRAFAATLVGGIDFSPLTSSVTFDFPLPPDSIQNIDSDGDGMPDMYEVYYGLDPDLGKGDFTLGRDGDPDGDGLSNLFEYYAGTNPWVKDSNNDGVLDPDTDSDNDGLTNLDEFRLGSHPKRSDTDDDGFLDGDETQSGSHPAFSDSQPTSSIVKSMRLDGQTYQVPQPASDRNRFNNRSWTVETWVRPDTAAESGALISCRGTVAGGTQVTYYELGLDAGIPYVRMQTEVQQQVIVEARGGALPAGEWTHVAGEFDPDKNALTIYLNGQSMASQQVLDEGLAGSLTAQAFPGKLFIGSVGGFSGNLDELRVWKVARTADGVADGIEHLVPAGDTRLVCYFRFDDGGTTAEDYAHPIRPPVNFVTERIVWSGNMDTAYLYCLSGVVFDATTAYTGTQLESDDYDGDKLPDWRENFGQFRTAYYPVLEDVWVTEETKDTSTDADGNEHTTTKVKYIYTGLRVSEVRSETILPHAERSVSMFDLGWGIDYGFLGSPGAPNDGATFTTVPPWTHPVDGTVQGRWITEPDSAWLIKDVYIEADEVATAEIRFGIHQIKDPRSQIVINGHPLRVMDLEAKRIGTYQRAESETFKDERWESYSDYFLDADFLRAGGYLKVGWNRIAVQQVNVDLNLADSRRYEQFWLTLTVAAGQKVLLAQSDRWWVYSHAGSMVEPPLDAAGRSWSDTEYGLDTYADTDGDGLSNYYEALVGTNPDSPDTDGDGVLDSHEDFDGDGLSNLREYELGSDPRLPDTDDDGFIDSVDGYMGSAVGWLTNSLLPSVERHLSLTDGTGYLAGPLNRRWSSGNSSFTLRLSVRPTALPVATTNVLAVREVAPGVYNYAILLLPSGRVEARVTVDTGNGTPEHIAVVSSAALALNQWADIDMVVDLDMQRLLLLVNGASDSALTDGSSFTDLRKLPAASGAGLVRTHFGVGLLGDLDNIAFYTSALSEAALAQVRTEGILSYPTETLQGAYLFDDGTAANGVSGAGWTTGQVQDFACLFWSEEDQMSSNFRLSDWQTGWRNAGTLVGVGAGIVDAYPIDDDTDSDGDGISDVWEKQYGLNPYLGDGENGADGDPDGDGLSNYAEYVLAVKHALYPGLNPRLFSTSQTVSDYFLRSGSVYFGEIVTDHDFMEDDWERQFLPSYVSPHIYDAHLDPDEDGWSNWAERRYSSARIDVRPDQVFSRDLAFGLTKDEFPIPVVSMLLRYNGALASAGNVVIHAFSKPSMDGQPDAVFAVSQTLAAKTFDVGYVTDRTAAGTLGHGGLQPKSLSLKLTDTWTGVSLVTGFDNAGVIYAGTPSAGWAAIGTIDYTTGEFALNLGHYAGKHLLVSSGAEGSTEIRTEYIDGDTAFLQVTYSAAMAAGWPKHLYLGKADTGYIREGTNYFFAFLDMDGSGTWSVTEPCGVPQPFVSDIGWHKNEVAVELTDNKPGMLRVNLAGGSSGSGSGLGTGTDGGIRVTVARVTLDGQPSGGWQAQVLVVSNLVGRTYLHEGDLLSRGMLALDWGLAGTWGDRFRIGYNVFLGIQETYTNNVVMSFTNVYPSVREKAVTGSPGNGSYVYSARPTFKWTQTTDYPAFALEIKRGLTNAPNIIIYNSGALQVPPRDVNGNYVWTAPIYANSAMPGGEVFDSNKVYSWRVLALNAKFNSMVASDATEWSDWKSFRLDVNAPVDSSGYGGIRARVKYYGPVTDLTSKVRVQVYRTASFSGLPDAEYTLAGVSDLANLTALGNPQVNAVMKGLPDSSVAGLYYVRAFIDSNENGVRDVWESWGYANYYGVDAQANPYDARPVEVAYSATMPIVDIVIEDADTDQDWFPDAWEYQKNPVANFLALTESATGTAGDTEINPWLSDVGPNMTSMFTALAAGTTDQDSDGLNDMAELLLGSDATVVSSAGDGYRDGDKYALGLLPTEILRLNVTGIDPSGANGPVLDWTVEVEESAEGIASRTSGPLSANAAVESVTYEVLYTPTLANSQWQVIQTGTVTLSGVKTLSSQIEALASEITPAQGFFKVRLVPPTP
jgi:hypothetical protein